MSEKELTQPDQWKLDHEFVDGEGERITCGRDYCTLGSYLLKSETEPVRYDMFAPACTTCEFTGSCEDVFNDAEPRFEPGAPEDFKRGAALVLTHARYSPLDAIRSGRPETVWMIYGYAKGAKSSKT